MADETQNWEGASGTKYTYWVHPITQSFQDKDGNYIFTKLENGYWIPLYIGQGNLSDRIGENHHKWACVKKKGATHVHAHLNGREADRKAEERDLLAKFPNAYMPAGCNEKEGG